MSSLPWSNGSALCCCSTSTSTAPVAQAGEAPDGMKQVELLALGGLVVQFVLQPEC